MTYEELVESARRYADIHPKAEIKLSDAVDVLIRKGFPFPARLAEYMAKHIEEQRASVNGTGDL